MGRTEQCESNASDGSIYFVKKKTEGLKGLQNMESSGYPMGEVTNSGNPREMIDVESWSISGYEIKRLLNKMA